MTIPDPGDLSVELVGEEAGLAALTPDWRRLAELRGNAFLTPEWFLAALHVGERSRRPLVAVARGGDGAIVGLLPFAERDGQAGHELVLAGPVATDLVHPVALREHEDAVAAAAVSALLDARPRHVLRLGNVDAAARWWRPESPEARRRLTPVAGPGEVLPYIEIAGLDWDEYLGTRSRGFRNEVGRKMRKLRREHDVVVRWTTGAEELTADLDTLFELHRARWRDRPGSSAFVADELYPFHQRFAAAALERGWLRLLTMEVDGAAAGSWYGWQLGDRWSYYQAGFDPAWSSYSIGTLVLAETVQRALEEGAAEYDLLLGGESFKSRFATGERVANRVALVSPQGPARLWMELGVMLRSGWRRLPAAVRSRIDRLREARGRR